MAVTLATATIAAGESLSNSIDCSTASPVRVRTPASWNGGPRGVVTFQISTDNITFYDYFHTDGTEVSAICVPGTAVEINRDFAGGTGGQTGLYLKVRAGTREAPVVQPSPCAFVFVLQS